MHAADDNHSPNGRNTAFILRRGLTGVPHADVNLVHHLHRTYRTAENATSRSPLICPSIPLFPLSGSFLGFVCIWTHIVQKFTEYPEHWLESFNIFLAK